MQISYQKFSLAIETIEEIHLPYYKGSTFRGGFGNAFRRIVCALKRQDCTDCMLKSRCIYAYVFETSPQEGTEIMNMHKYEKVPHPFVIEPPEINAEDPIRLKTEGKNTTLNSQPSALSLQPKALCIKPGKVLSFNLILIGRATEYLPYFIYTFDELGRFGIGRGRGRYRLIEVKKWKKGNGRWSTEERPVYSALDKTIRQTNSDIIEFSEFRPSENLDSLTLRFITPLRLKYNRDLVVKPEFHILVRALLRRLGLLYYFHCGNRKPEWDHRSIISHAERVEIQSSSLRWLDWERYSSRQDTRMKLGGLVGEIAYHGNIEPFLPVIEAGEVLHAGKGTSFGLGRYEIVCG
ncbi:CRISPR system precrRNA processing endoribonuclease RAMP protein Cas6 [hot springs metagenome]|uniref:CRISPR system precrRNA processing endoribonuclease RAMP protein Cas6 n=1 Tax=hot springs metagenome TaxID=433727 RepID=A0A5J4L4X4_9ZZZZ